MGKIDVVGRLGQSTLYREIQFPRHSLHFRIATTKINQLVLFRHIQGFGCQNYTKHTHIQGCQKLYTHFKRCHLFIVFTFFWHPLYVYKYIQSGNRSQRDALFLKIYFGKELYIFRTDLPSIIRSLNTVFTAIGICRTSCVDCLLARSGFILTSLVVNITSTTNTTCCEYRFKTPDDGQQICPKHVEFFIKIKLRNSASR